MSPSPWRLRPVVDPLTSEKSPKKKMPPSATDDAVRFQLPSWLLPSLDGREGRDSARVGGEVGAVTVIGARNQLYDDIPLAAFDGLGIAPAAVPLFPAQTGMSSVYNLEEACI